MSYTPFISIPVYIDYIDKNGFISTHVEDCKVRTSRIECIDPVPNIDTGMVESTIILFSAKEFYSPMSPADIEKLIMDAST